MTVKAGHEEPLELLARALRREHLRVLRLEQRRAAVALASSSSSSFSSRSRSSSRIWNQLTAATRMPMPRKIMLTWPASELA